LISEDLVQSAHDVSEGGLFVSLVESAIPRQLGFRIATSPEIRKDAFLFGESQSRVVVTVKADQVNTLKDHLKHKGVSFHQIGQVKDHEALIDGEHFGRIDELAAIYHGSLEAEMNR
jgi:phosphoribosylformylglycinamidine synthase